MNLVASVGWVGMGGEKFLDSDDDLFTRSKTVFSETIGTLR